MIIAAPPSCLTYPARPVNGGPLDQAEPKHGNWCYEPKYNGWRALVHTPTGTMWNRHGKRLSIESEFQIALRQIKTGWLQAIEWLDVEALERRHHIGRGSLIILDCPFTPKWRQPAPYGVRRFELMVNGGAEHIPIHSDLNQPIKDHSVYLVASYPGKNRVQFDAEQQHLQLWNILQQCNIALGCDKPGNHFYEGVVAKREDSLYPIQLRSPELEFPFWMKHRWAF